ncbi:hypothetical protein CR513_56653, partial [Mucuna pruriens]
MIKVPSVVESKRIHHLSTEVTTSSKLEQSELHDLLKGKEGLSIKPRQQTKRPTTISKIRSLPIAARERWAANLGGRATIKCKAQQASTWELPMLTNWIKRQGCFRMATSYAFSMLSPKAIGEIVGNGPHQTFRASISEKL